MCLLILSFHFDQWKEFILTERSFTGNVHKMKTTNSGYSRILCSHKRSCWQIFANEQFETTSNKHRKVFVDARMIQLKPLDIQNLSTAWKFPLHGPIRLRRLQSWENASLPTINWRSVVESKCPGARLDLTVNFHHGHFIDPTNCMPLGLRGCAQPNPAPWWPMICLTA